MKGITALLIAMLLVNLSFAQTKIGGRSVRLGFKLDPGISNVLHPNEAGIEKDGSKIGFAYGLMTDFLFNDGRGAFASGIEIIHASSSIKYTDASKGLDPAISQVYDIRLQYIQAPLSIKLKSNRNNNIAGWGQFGTYLGVPLRARADYGNVEKRNIYSNITKINSGLLLGAGGEYQLDEKTDLFFGLGFENGFVDVTRNKDWHDGKINLNRWAIRLGVFF